MPAITLLRRHRRASRRVAAVALGAALGLALIPHAAIAQAAAAPGSTSVRDIRVAPVEPAAGVTANDFLRGYTNAELDAAKAAVPKRDEPALAAPNPRAVTATGRVFVDANANRVCDAGERGLPGVLVSDGERTARTGPDGRYAFSLRVEDEAHHRFVFATRPTGYRPTSAWFLRIPFAADPTAYQADFGFVEDAASARRDFWFLVVSDSQFTRVGQMIPTAKDYAQFTAAPGKPAFLVTVGDLTMSGTQHEWDMYDRIRGASGLMVYDGFGGHDGNCPRPRSTVSFERRIGPPWYSWDYAGVHFVQFVTESHYLRPKALARHRAWVLADLRAVGKGTPVIAVSHYPLPAGWFDERKKEGVRLLCQLAAHWHVVQRGSRGDVPVLISAPARGRDWGAFSRTCRWVRVTEGRKLHTSVRVAGQYRRLRIVAPAPRAIQGKQPFLVLAYDTSRRVESVRVRARAPGGATVPLRLTQHGDWSWLGAFEPGHTGRWQFVLEATDSAGEVWTREQAVTVTAGRLAAPQVGPDLPWVLSGTPPRRLKGGPKPPLYPLWITHSGSRHVIHASPVVAAGRVFVAVTDPNVGTPGSGVLCLDAHTGRPLWRGQSPLGDIRGPLTVHQGRVFATTAEGWVAAYDAETGASLWSRPLKEAYRLGRPLAINQTPPVPTNHGLLVSDWQAPQFLLDYETGKQLAVLNGNVGYYAAYPTVFHDVMYCARRGGALALSAPSGDTLWEAEEKSRSTSAGIVVDGKYIYTCSRGVRALHASTGKPVWQAGWSQAGYRNPVPVVWDDLVLANGVALLGLDLATGERRFAVGPSTDPTRFERSQRQSLGGSSTPIVAGGVAYYGHDDTSVRAIDNAGRVVWQCPLGTPIKTSPAASGNLLFIHDFAGNLWCFAPLEAAE